MDLAQIDLQVYIEGTYPQSVENAKTALSMAKLNLKNVEEDLDQTKVLYGKGFVTLGRTSGWKSILRATTIVRRPSLKAGFLCKKCSRKNGR